MRTVALVGVLALVGCSSSSSSDAGDAGEIDGGDGGCAPDSGVCCADSDCGGGLACNNGLCSLRVCPGPDVNGCTAYQDESGAGGSRSVVFPMPGGAEGYSPACLQVAVGQPVSFSGDFAGFPIVQTCGQPQPVPADPNAAVIVQPDAGTWASYTFKAPGAYGYAWLFDAGVGGAILVVP